MIDPRQKYLIKCSQCGARNRIPGSRVGQTPVCGKCRNKLSLEVPYPETGIEVTDRNFEEEVIRFPGTVFLYVWAPWCGYCRRMTPVVDSVIPKYAGRIKFAKMMLEQNPATASRYDIQGVPATLLFKHGKMVKRLSGAIPGYQLEQELQAIA